MEEELVIMCVWLDIWEAATGEELLREGETRNTKDRYAVAVKSYAHENIRGPASIANTTKIFVHRKLIYSYSNGFFSIQAKHGHTNLCMMCIVKCRRAFGSPRRCCFFNPL